MTHAAPTVVTLTHNDVAKSAHELRSDLMGLLDLVDRLLASSSLPGGLPSERGLLTIHEARSRRSAYLPSDRFAYPAWDILLSLFASHVAQRRVAMLCSDTLAEDADLLRWIATLERRGLIIRRADPLDGQRVFICLAKDVLRLMEALFETLPSGEPTP